MSISIWRKLWASVSLSKKVNKLSDQSALFWTWAIPHFSTHGFLEYDPEDLKSIIVPLRPSYTPKIIATCVQEILNQNLWQAWSCPSYKDENPQGRVNVILRDSRWFEMQNIRKDRISQLPYNIKEMERIYKLLPECPGQSRSVLVPECPAIEIEESEMRVRERKAEETNDRPVDNPKNSGITKDQQEHLDKLCSILKNTFQRPKHNSLFNPYQFIQKFKDSHPDAMIKTLSRMIEEKNKIISPWPWAEHVLTLESQNYNAQDFQIKSEKDKSIYSEIITDIKSLHKNNP